MRLAAQITVFMKPTPPCLYRCPSFVDLICPQSETAQTARFAGEQPEKLVTPPTPGPTPLVGGTQEPLVSLCNWGAFEYPSRVTRG